MVLASRGMPTPDYPGQRPSESMLQAAEHLSRVLGLSRMVN